MKRRKMDKEDIKKIQENIFAKLEAQTKNIEGDIGFAIIQVGLDPVSTIYVGKKEEMARSLGIRCKKILLDERMGEQEIVENINKLNGSEDILGIIVQLPLPKGLNSRKILDTIDPKKDVDGLTTESLGKLFEGEKDGFFPATPAAVLGFIKEKEKTLEGKRAVIVGRSNLVGKPLSSMLLNEDATVTICHSKTKNLKEITKEADILVTAFGSPRLITVDMVKEGVSVFDIGINRVDGKIVGDVDEGVAKKAKYLSPVPGGIGPLTVLQLMANILKAAQKNEMR
jgi:methylenetetrahydrofolate dehydrogenase (NADP+)/methenyltetrahydrofolate cyclohydrolase